MGTSSELGNEVIPAAGRWRALGFTPAEAEEWIRHSGRRGSTVITLAFEAARCKRWGLEPKHLRHGIPTGMAVAHMKRDWIDDWDETIDHEATDLTEAAYLEDGWAGKASARLANAGILCYEANEYYSKGIQGVDQIIEVRAGRMPEEWAVAYGKSQQP